MLRRLSRHIRQNAVAWLALFVALGGTSAYAANTIRSSDIIDNEVTTTDVRDDTLGFGGLYNQDIAAGAIRSSEVLDNSIRGADIENNSISGADIAPDGLTGSDIAANSLGGREINEATLSLPPTTTATFAGLGSVRVSDAYAKIVGRTLPAGSYAIAATANVGAFVGQSDAVRDTSCELRNHNGQFIGGGHDRRHIVGGDTTNVSISMNGGVQVPAAGGEVGVYCRFQAAPSNGVLGDAQMMIIRLDGFF